MNPWDRPWLSVCLRPLALAYALGWRLLKAWHGRRPWRAPVPVLSVGNLSVGGTGKSPLARLLAQRALAKGRRPAVLLRGYGALGGPRPLAVSLGQDPLASPAASGDEAQEHALQARVAVWVDADRRRSAQAACEAGADALILDDGFQRRWQLARDLDLLVADWTQLQGAERLLPAGPWREPWSQARQADAFVISHAPHGIGAKALARALPAAWQGRPVFRLDLRPKGLKAWPHGKAAPLAGIKGRAVSALSGLGNPGAFEAGLKALGATVLPWRFADHHAFSSAELALIPKGAQAVVTTLKDAQRLPSDWKPPVPVWVLLAEAQVSPAAPFEALLRKALHRARS
jgi:tetraacyldisaccharide 4'-kinase